MLNRKVKDSSISPCNKQKNFLCVLSPVFVSRFASLEKNSTITERPLAKAWGRSSSLILPSSSIWKSVTKSKHENVSSATYKTCNPLCEIVTFETISNFEKGAKIYFVSNMASRSTVLLKPFASKRYFLVCQQNLVVALYYGSRKNVENLVGFPKANQKLKTVKFEASIENVAILFNFVQL